MKLQCIATLIALTLILMIGCSSEQDQEQAAAPGQEQAEAPAPEETPMEGETEPVPSAEQAQEMLDEAEVAEEPLTTSSPDSEQEGAENATDPQQEQQAAAPKQTSAEEPEKEPIQKEAQEEPQTSPAAQPDTQKTGSTTAPEVPDELLLKAPEGVEPKQSPVEFSHIVHQDLDCTACHHEWDGTSEIQGCSDSGCHDLLFPKSPQDRKDPLYFYNAYHDRQSEISCVGCHSALKKAGNPTGPTGCVDCHPKETS
ncbi:MAG: cytochrome c3 family protein [bacterium]